MIDFENKIILAIDPSSTRTGYCVMDFKEELLEAGLILPAKITLDAAQRIKCMCDDIDNILQITKPDYVVVEWTSGKVGSKRHKGNGAGLAIYGVSIGAIWITIEHWAARACEGDDKPATAGKPVVILIDENDWTGGTPKRQRAETIRRLYPTFDFSKDTGGDITDSVGLGRYYIGQKKMELLRSQV